MRAGECARQCGVQVGSYIFTVTEGDEVDILAESALGKVSSR